MCGGRSITRIRGRYHTSTGFLVSFVWLLLGIFFNGAVSIGSHRGSTVYERRCMSCKKNYFRLFDSDGLFRRSVYPRPFSLRNQTLVATDWVKAKVFEGYGLVLLIVDERRLFIW